MFWYIKQFLLADLSSPQATICAVIFFICRHKLVLAPPPEPSAPAGVLEHTCARSLMYLRQEWQDVCDGSGGIDKPGKIFQVPDQTGRESDHIHAGKECVERVLWW